MLAATRRQRARAANDTGEQALLVTRKNGWIDTLFDARSEAVCRSAALADDVYCSIVAKGRLAIDAETARRLVVAIGTEPPPLSDTDDFFACRARHAAGRACEAARVIFHHAKKGACDSAHLLLEAGFVPTAVGAYRRSVSVALSAEPLDIEKLSAFGLARSCAEALEALAAGVVQRDPGPDDAFRTSRVPVGAEYVSRGVLETMTMVLTARGDENIRSDFGTRSDSTPIARLRDATLELASSVFMCMRDLSSIDASLVRAIGSFVGNDWTGALALGALTYLATIHEDMEPPKGLTDAASRALCEPQVVEAIANTLSHGYTSCALIVEVLVKATPHARALATPSVIAALLEVISLNDDDARTAYEKRHRYGRTSRTQQHTGFVTPDGGPVDRRLPPDELCLIAVRAMLKAGSFAAAPNLEAALVVPIVDKLRASFVDPTPGPELYELRCACFAILETLAPRHAKEIVKAGGIDVAMDCLKQLKLPGSTAVLRLTEMSAHNPLNFLHELIITGPAYADAVRLELKEFTNHPEFSTFDRLCDTWHGTSWRAWFVQQLANAPGGPPAWMQA